MSEERHGRVYPKASTWTMEHRRWLSRQQFDEQASEVVFADLLAAVDGLSQRKAQIALRLSDVALDEQWWPTVARLCCFRGIPVSTSDLGGGVIGALYTIVAADAGKTLRIKIVSTDSDVSVTPTNATTALSAEAP